MGGWPTSSCAFAASSWDGPGCLRPLSSLPIVLHAEPPGNTNSNQSQTAVMRKVKPKYILKGNLKGIIICPLDHARFYFQVIHTPGKLKNWRHRILVRESQISPPVPAVPKEHSVPHRKMSLWWFYTARSHTSEGTGIILSSSCLSDSFQNPKLREKTVLLFLVSAVMGAQDGR